jgi:hypothetical protein
LATTILERAPLFAPLGIVATVIALTPAPTLFIPASDLLTYQHYADLLLAGAVPGRDFAPEYPPLALLPMVLPRLLPPFGDTGSLGYAVRFTLMEGVLACVVGWLISRVSDDPAGALATWVVLVLLCATPVAWRYDLWPAALVLVAIVAADRDRPGLAGVAIGAGVMLKLFPLVVLPVLGARAVALRDWTGLARLLTGAAVVIAALLAGSLALAGPGGLHWLGYQIDRGLQLETIGAGLLLLAHLVVGLPVRVDQAFGSLQVSAPTAPGLVSATVTAGAALTIVGVATVCALGFVRFRRERSSVGRVALPSVAAASVAVLVALLVTSKVFSAQYVLWFLPLVPLLAWPARFLAMAIAGISWFIYPAHYEALWQLEPGLIGVLNVRNLLLPVLLAWLAVELARRVPGVTAGPIRAEGGQRLQVHPEQPLPSAGQSAG